jgi:Restriction endonuclease
MPVRLDVTPEDYEEGVATLLAEKFPDGVVERDVRLPSKSGVRDRQVDVLVRLPLADMVEQTIVVDCKRYGSYVDVKDVEAFIGLVDDVGADLGVLVTTEGFTAGAAARAASVRGIRVQVIPLSELPTWEPPLVLCDLCAEAVGEDALPGMAYVDSVVDVESTDGELVTVTVGYCEKCGGLHMQCPTCGVIQSVSEWRTDEWVECEGGCGLEMELRKEMTKDDLSNPAHDRLTLRMHAN